MAVNYNGFSNRVDIREQRLRDVSPNYSDLDRAATLFFGKDSALFNVDLTFSRIPLLHSKEVYIKHVIPLVARAYKVFIDEQHRKTLFTGIAPIANIRDILVGQISS